MLLVKSAPCKSCCITHPGLWQGQPIFNLKPALLVKQGWQPSHPAYPTSHDAPAVAISTLGAKMSKSPCPGD